MYEYSREYRPEGVVGRMGQLAHKQEVVEYFSFISSPSGSLMLSAHLFFRVVFCE